MVNKMLSHAIEGIPDYRELYPKSQADTMRNRGGDFDQDISDYDIENIASFLSQTQGLLNGQLDGYTVFRQKDAFSPHAQAVRNEVLLMLGNIAGFDVEGELNNNEVDGAEAELADSDIEAFGIDDLYGQTVKVDYRQIVFGSIKSKSDWSITEIEIPHTAIVINDKGISTENSTLRILNVTAVHSEA